MAEFAGGDRASTIFPGKSCPLIDLSLSWPLGSKLSSLYLDHPCFPHAHHRHCLVAVQSTHTLLGCHGTLFMAVMAVMARKVEGGVMARNVVEYRPYLSLLKSVDSNVDMCWRNAGSYNRQPPPPQCHCWLIIMA